MRVGSQARRVLTTTVVKATWEHAAQRWICGRQTRLHHSKRSKHMPAVDDGEQYEYGDVKTHAIDADTSDFSPHQFIAPDKACDAMGSDDNDEQDAANNDAARSKILSAEVFD